jgi:hypothetical protein
MHGCEALGAIMATSLFFITCFAAGWYGAVIATSSYARWWLLHILKFVGYQAVAMGLSALLFQPYARTVHGFDQWVRYARAADYWYILSLHHPHDMLTELGAI